MGEMNHNLCSTFPSFSVDKLNPAKYFMLEKKDLI